MKPVTYVRKRLPGAQVIDLHIIRAAGLHGAAGGLSAFTYFDFLFPQIFCHRGTYTILSFVLSLSRHKI